MKKKRPGTDHIAKRNYLHHLLPVGVWLVATFDDPLVKAQDQRTDGYYTMLKEQGPLFKGAPPFPFHPQAVTTGQTYIWKALSGELSASDALDQACAAIEEQLIQLGYGQ